MTEGYVPLINALNSLGEAVKAVFNSNTPVSLLQGSWSLPGITRNELVSAAIDLAARVSSVTTEPSTDSLLVISELAARIEFLEAHTVPYLSSQPAAIPAYLITLESVEKALRNVLLDSKSIAHRESLALKRSGAQIRGMENRIKDLSSRTVGLEGMVKAIERAHDAADQLPTDLETLAESQKKVNALLSESERDRAHIETARESIETLDKNLADKAAEAAAVLARCESAYSSATSLGLAAAFTERSKALDTSMWGWVGGLVASLLIGGGFGTWQLRNLADVLANPQAQGLSIGVNLVLSVLSVGGPVWFAWLATKQIGQRFRLSEDYAFKASISRAYEGYRREAARIDPDLESQLLRSALSRLDEQPLRLVESASYGSPWHELLSSDVVKDAAKTIPGFVDKVMGFASDSLDRVKPKQSLVAANSDQPASLPEADKV